MYLIDGPYPERKSNLVQDRYVVSRSEGGYVRMRVRRIAASERNVVVCSGVPSAGWMDGQYGEGCFMAIGDFWDADCPGDEPVHWVVRWLDADGLVHVWPGRFVASAFDDGRVLCMKLIEQMERGSRAIDMARRSVGAAG